MAKKKNQPNFGLAILVVLLCILIILGGAKVINRDRFTIDQASEVIATTDGQPYLVHESYDDYQQAANLLSHLNARIIVLMRALREKYIRGPAGDEHPKRRQAVLLMLSRYNPDNLVENAPDDPSGDTAYSLDKGAIFAICLRERKRAVADGEGPARNELHDLDVLTFVTLHELSHVAVEVRDHPPEFWSTFAFILNEAAIAGVYVSPDYSQDPQSYCGLKVNYTPSMDPNLVPI